MFFYKRKRTRHSHREASTDGDRQKLSNPVHPSCSDPGTAVIGHKGPQEGKGQGPVDCLDRHRAQETWQRNPNPGPDLLQEMHRQRTDSVACPNLDHPCKYDL